MHRIEPVNYPRVRPLFDLPHLGFVMDAMIARNSPAVIFVDTIAQPRSAFVWDKAHSVYLAGDAANAEFNAKLAAVIADDWMSHVQNFGVFKVYTSDEDWLNLSAELFPNTSLTRRERVFYGGGDFRIAGRQNCVPAGFRMESITEALLANPAMKNAERVTEEIASCWNDISQFYTDGFGYCLVTDDDEIVAWCTAEYKSDGKCGIGIETIEPYMKRGFATLTASAFVRTLPRPPYRPPLGLLGCEHPVCRCR